ncbi:hypothetical protein [Dactylosporangium sp. NPDC006015]|uniref:hypothetical protein n=1 Tax=Dactylosporangium sp. NPDC006015 TaxID=3154576 RepID=UPI0033A6C23A
MSAWKSTQRALPCSEQPADQEHEQHTGAADDGDRQLRPAGGGDHLVVEGGVFEDHRAECHVVAADERDDDLFDAIRVVVADLDECPRHPVADRGADLVRGVMVEGGADVVRDRAAEHHLPAVDDDDVAALQVAQPPQVGVEPLRSVVQRAGVLLPGGVRWQPERDVPGHPERDVLGLGDRRAARGPDVDPPGHHPDERHQDRDQQVPTDQLAPQGHCHPPGVSRQPHYRPPDPGPEDLPPRVPERPGRRQGRRSCHRRARGSTWDRPGHVVWRRRPPHDG